MNRWTAEYGNVFGCNVLNGATENGNLHIQGLQANSLKELNDRAEAELNGLYEKQEAVRKRISVAKELEAYIKSLENSVADLEKNFESRIFEKETLVKTFMEQPHIKEQFSKYQQDVERNWENFKASKNPFKRRNRDMER